MDRPRHHERSDALLFGLFNTIGTVTLRAPPGASLVSITAQRLMVPDGSWHTRQGYGVCRGKGGYSEQNRRGKMASGQVPKAIFGYAGEVMPRTVQSGTKRPRPGTGPLKRSHALDLEHGVFRLNSPSQIAESAKQSAMRSKRREGTPYQSAMSLLKFYITRQGKR